NTAGSSWNCCNCLVPGASIMFDFSGANCPVTGVSFSAIEYDINTCYTTKCSGYPVNVTSPSVSFSDYGSGFTVNADATGFTGVTGLGPDSGDPPPSGPPGCGGASGGPPGRGGGAVGDEAGDSDAPADGGSGLENGMPVWTVSQPYLNVWLLDSPM